MSGVYIKGLNIKPCKDGFDGKGLVIIGYDDKLYAVAHEHIIPLPDHGDLIDRDEAADDACLIWGRNSSGDDAAQEIIEHLRKMEAVIPADRSEASPCDNCDERNDVGCSWCKMMERSEE